ncbi:hypothetical protein Mal4_40680 [Maioricimonas rarisocia]|uniref:Methyltransferase type 11 domain-containing protein n=1 Tax=Maioricimonas rarisocia TaxID=2528026 RepID=A0A517ZBB4_9PLAN|nr:class I SAM-dependent methyltransferase [Maioricimonas rarisocia]QDU39721.1 hypothetical protein Mal4_40680 [Maioricimonas rarisocia]
MSQEGTRTAGQSHGQLPVSERVLAKLLRRARVSRGGTVLDIGSAADRVVEHLLARGFDAFGVCPEESVPAATSDRVQIGRLAATLPVPPHKADLVLIRDADLYRPVHADPESLTATANLLAALRPGRELILIEPAQPGPDRAADAPVIDAWNDHFAAFPGRLKIETVRVRPALFGLFGGGPSFEFRLAGFKVPSQARTRLEWHRLAHEAAMQAMRSAEQRAA